MGKDRPTGADPTREVILKQQVAVGIVAVALVGGSATGLIVRDMRSDATVPVSSPTSSATTSDPTPKPSPSTSASPPAAQGSAGGGTKTSQAPAEPALLPLGSMQINTGSVGPVSAGMTQEQAGATGYFNVDVPSDTCEGGTPLEWKSNYYNALDVATTPEGTIVSIGVTNRGPTTRSGLGINSTYGQVRKVIGTDKLPEPAGYSQTGLFVNDGTGWIGFLFDAQPDSIEDSAPVSFIEVTRGAKPGLTRDGC